MNKLSNTEAELKKGVAYVKKGVYEGISIEIQMWYSRRALYPILYSSNARKLESAVDNSFFWYLSF